MNSISKLLKVGFCVFWMVLIFVDYWFYHPEYADAIQYFQYLDTIILLGVLGGGSYWMQQKWGDQKPLKYLQGGLGVVVLLLLISAVILWTHYFKVSKEVLGLGGFVYVGKLTYLLLACYFIFSFCFLLGDWIINKLFSFSFPKLDDRMIKMALGVAIYALALVLLGFLGFLNTYLLWGTMIGLVALRWKAALNFGKASLLMPLNASNRLNWVGYISFFSLLIFISLNLLNNIRPVPFGFDALALYLNLPNLISQQGGLIEGYSPYYWSLFTALGLSLIHISEPTRPY